MSTSIIKLPESLNVDNARDYYSELEELLSSKNEDICFDGADLKKFDILGAQMIMAAKDHCQQSGVTCEFKNVAGEIKTKFQSLGFALD
jgi:anti-anti-sigma regulatory factor